MKKKKSKIIIIISILVVIGIAVGLYFILNDKDKLTVSERNWVNQNIGTIQNKLIHILGPSFLLRKKNKSRQLQFLFSEENVLNQYKQMIVTSIFKTGTIFMIRTFLNK